MDNLKWTRVAACVGFIDLALCGTNLFLLEFLLQSDDAFIGGWSISGSVFLVLIWTVITFVRSLAAVLLIKSSLWEDEPEKARKGSIFWLNVNLIWFLLTLPLVITIVLSSFLNWELLILLFKDSKLQIAIVLLSWMLSTISYGLVLRFIKELNEVIKNQKPSIKVVLPEVVISTDVLNDTKTTGNEDNGLDNC
ncbi:unnamed protein product [Orchesella dallaii]|uniref:Transmembrane protein n=1 Tax=Orchesella dallaii TaxID=48710 RepID=A0ABP1RIJ9_9HEXA